MKFYHVNAGRAKNVRCTLLLALVIALFTSVSYPASLALAATSSISLSQPADIEFYKTSDGQTEMLIADSGNNRVIRATPEGEVLSTMEVNHVTAVTMGNDGLIYAAESGASSQIHIFNPDGSVNATSIDIMHKLSMYSGHSEAEQPYIRNVIRYKENNFERLSILYNEYYLVNNAPESTGTLAGIVLGLEGWGGMSGAFSDYSGATMGTDSQIWYTYGPGAELYPIPSIQNTTDKLGDLTLDLVNKQLYIVSENKIMRTNYEEYVDRPVLSTWVSGNETYPIDLGNQIGVGPEGEVYMADKARDRIVVFSADGTSARILGLSQGTSTKPAAGAFSKTVKKGLPVEFTAADFASNYADSEDQPMTDIRITSLPDSGKLQLHGTDVVKDQIISVAELNSLTYIPSSAFTAIKTSFTWQAKNGTVFSDNANVTIMLRIKGDANGDGVITPADALLVNKYIKGLITLTPDQIEVLDMNDDGVLDANDTALIMGIYLGINS